MYWTFSTLFLACRQHDDTHSAPRPRLTIKCGDVVAIGVAVVLVVALHTCTHATVATYLQNERSRSLVYTEKEIKIIYGVPFSLPYSLESHFLSHIHTHTQNIISLPCVRVQPIWCPYVALCYWSVASSSTYTLLHIVFV